MNLRESVAVLRSPADVLGVVPQLVGFHPTSSMVVMCLHGLRRRAGLVMRVDLPAPATEAQVRAQWVREVMARVQAEAAGAVVLACYTEEPDTGGALARSGLVASMVDGFSAADIAVPVAMLVRNGRWWSYLCVASCCPPSGAPLDVPLGGVSAQLAAAAALAGRVVLDSRAELVATVSGPVAPQLIVARQTFEQVAARMLEERHERGADAVCADTVARVQAAVKRFTAGEGELGDEEVARICLGLGDKRARDEVAAVAVGEVGEPAWLGLLAALTRSTPDGAAAPVCTVLAWVAYQHGDGALANVALDRALRDDPSYTMARLLRESLDRQVSPEVIRSVSRPCAAKSCAAK